MAIVLSNPLRRDPHDRRAGDDAPLAFHRSLPGYAESRLVPCPRLADDLSLTELWVKDESARFGLPSFKVLGASWACVRALADRLDRPAGELGSLADLAAVVADGPRLSFAAATDGNHGRAVARMAAILGLDATILVPVGTAAARIDAIAGEGAEVRVVDGTYDEAVAASAALASETSLVISDTSWPGYHDVPGWVIDGYSTIFAEVDGQLAAGGDGVDVVLVPMGVGALMAAAVRWADARPSGHRPLVVAVEPTTAACGLRSAEAGEPVAVPGPHHSIMAGLNCGTVSELAWPEVAAGVDTFVAVDDADAERAMRDLAAAGVVAGETGAAALAGLSALQAGPSPLDPQTRALVLCTEGATDPDAYARIVGPTH